MTMDIAACVGEKPSEQSHIVFKCPLRESCQRFELHKILVQNKQAGYYADLFEVKPTCEHKIELPK